jgi:hypothetical protein
MTREMNRRWTRRAALASAILAALSGCGRGESPAVPSPLRRADGPPRAATIAELSPAERKWGIAPTRSAEVTYQPDVVMLDEGADAILEMSPNGLEWTIDARASHARDIQPGKVLFATSRVAGRVLAVSDKGGKLAVILGPVELTDVIRDAKIEFTTPVDFSQAMVYVAPESPGSLSESSTPLKTALDPVWPGGWPGGGPGPTHALGRDTGTMMFRRAQNTVGVEGFKIRPEVSLNSIGASITWDDSGLYFVGKSSLRLEKPQLNFALHISGGKLLVCELSLSGAAGLQMEFAARSAAGTKGNINKVLHIPADISLPLINGKVPFTVTIRQSFLVQTAFGAKGHLQARGDYSMGGAIAVGYRNEHLGVTAPGGLKANERLIDTIEGVSLTPTGVVLTHRARVIVGIGALGFVTGPFFSLSNAVGITRHADTDQLARCNQANVYLYLDAGVGYFMPNVIVNGLNALLGALNLGKIKNEGGFTLLKPHPILSNTSVYPQSKAPAVDSTHPGAGRR